MPSLQRRTFLASAASAAASAFQSSTDTVTTAIIGTGGRGTYLMKGVMQQPGAKIVAVCDIKPDRLDRAASVAARDNPTTFTDYRRLLERKDIQAVYIASPCDLHVEMAIAAIQAGKHVYCEKPVGITAESIGRLVKVARAAKTVFQVGQQMRSDARLAKSIARVQEGAIGKVVMVKAQRHASDDLSHDGSSADWFFDAKRSGDVIVEMSVHNLDACNWVIGSRPERAGGFGGALIWANDPPGRTNMDGYTLSYEYANGVKLSYTQVFFHPRGMPGGGQYMYVYGTEGGIDLMESMIYRRARDSKPEQIAPPERPSVDAHIAGFYEAIRTGKKPPADITIGATGALTAILGREAIYQKKVMTWKDLGVDV
jgi:predicted dehydrogenase